MMMKLRITSLILLFLAAATGAAAQMPGGSDPFQVSAVQASDDSGRVYVDLKIQIKYSRLVFFRDGERYKAGYRVYLQFFSNGSDRMAKGDVFSGEVTAESYSETRSSRRALNIQKDIDLPPGDYRIRVAIEVKGTRIRYNRETSISLSESDIFISNPVFFVSEPGGGEGKPPRDEIRIDLGGSESGDFSRRLAGVYTDPGSWLRSSITISSPASTGSIRVSVKILSREDRTVCYNLREYTAAPGKSVTLHADMNVDNYTPGSYTLAVHATDGEEKAGSAGDFFILFNMNSLTEDFESTLQLLSLVASEKDLSALAETESSRRIEAWKKFWNSGGEDYNLDEFREKVAYAARHFSGSRPGWDSDMGRVYIRNGKPDRSVTRWSRWGGERYNFWYYYSLGLVYVFVDSFGTGDYRLIDTRNI